MIRLVNIIFIFLFGSVQVFARDSSKETRKLQLELETELRNKYQYRGSGFANPYYGTATDEEYYEGLKKFKEALAKTQDPISFSNITRLYISGEKEVESHSVPDYGEVFYFSAKEPFGAYIELLSKKPGNEPYFKEYLIEKTEKVNLNLREQYGQWYEFHRIGKNILCNQEIPVDESGLKEYIDKMSEHKIEKVKSFNISRKEDGRIWSDIEIMLDSEPPVIIVIEPKDDYPFNRYELSIVAGKFNYSYFSDRYTWSEFDENCKFREGKYWEYNRSGSIEKRLWLDSNGEEERIVFGNKRPLSLEEIYGDCKGAKSYEYFQEIAERTDQVLVTILDSGVDYNHPEIAYKIKRPKVSENESLKTEFLEILENSRSPREAELLIEELERELELQQYLHVDRYYQIYDLIPLEDESIYEKKIKELEDSISDLQDTLDNMNFALKFFMGSDISAKISVHQHEINLTKISLQGVKERNAIAEKFNEQTRKTNSKATRKNQENLKLKKEKEEETERLKAQIKQVREELKKSEAQISDLKKKIKTNAIGWDFEEDDDEPYDYYDYLLNIRETFDHGTHVAGIASEGSDNIAILPIKYPKTKNEKFYEAIAFAHERGSRIVNISLGGNEKEYWEYLSKAMTDFTDMLFVVAAGNEKDDLDLTPHYPAAFDHPNMLVVAAVDEDNKLSYYSNYSKTKVDVAAPGDDILSLSTENTHDEKSGTSMATPFVTRIAAKIKFINPALSPRQIIAIIRDSVTPVEELRFKVKYGGVVNEEKAMEIAHASRK